MRERIRWFHLESTGDALSVLARRMANEEYEESRGEGFQVDEAGRSETQGVYIERVEAVEEVEDPFGKLLTFRRIEYQRVRFRIGSKLPNLELINPPRTCRSFFQRLNTLLKNKLSVEPVRPDVTRWIKELEADVGRVRVTSMALADITLSEAAHADVIVTGHLDVRSEARKLLASRPHIIAAATLEWKAGGASASCELSRNGANAEGSVPEGARLALRGALQRSVAARRP